MKLLLLEQEHVLQVALRRGSNDSRTAEILYLSLLLSISLLQMEVSHPPFPTRNERNICDQLEREEAALISSFSPVKHFPLREHGQREVTGCDIESHSVK